MKKFTGILFLFIITSILVSCNTTTVYTLNMGHSYVDLEVDSYTDMNLTIEPAERKEDPIIVWSSDNKDVVTVNSDGRVTAVAPGLAVISARIEDQEDSAVTANVYVFPKFELKRTEYSIEKDSSTKIELSSTPEVHDFPMEWSSNDESIAVVDQDGLVTGISEGKVNIVVNIDRGKKLLTSEVTVLPKKVIGVNVKQKTITLTTGSSDKIDGTVYPSDAKNKNVSWTSSDTSIVEVGNDGTIVGKNAGKAEVTIQTEDGGFVAKTIVIVKPKLEPKKEVTKKPKQTEPKIQSSQEGMIDLKLDGQKALSFQTLVEFIPQPDHMRIKVIPAARENGKLMPPQPYQNYDFKAIFHTDGEEVIATGKTNFQWVYVHTPHDVVIDKIVPIEIYITFEGKTYKINDTLIK